MVSLSFITGGALIGVNVHALAALVMGLRRREAASVSNLSRRWPGRPVASYCSLPRCSRRRSTTNCHAVSPSSHATRLAMGLARHQHGGVHAARLRAPAHRRRHPRHPRQAVDAPGSLSRRFR